MEKTRDEILSEIRQSISELKAQVSELEKRLTEIEGAEPAIVEDAPIEMAAVEISLDDIMDVDFSEPVPVSEPEPMPEPEIVPEPAEEPVQQPEFVPEPVEEPVADLEPVPVPEVEIVPPVEEPVAEPVVEPEPVAEPEPEEESLADFFGGFAASDEGTLNAKHRVHQKKAVIDVMAADEAWRKDMPGSAVKNVLSAISLNDRILFIRSLFDEDAAEFSSMVETINSAESFDEAVDVIKGEHPEWDYNSDTVYRFMMAVRRRLR